MVIGFVQKCNSSPKRSVTFSRIRRSNPQPHITLFGNVEKSHQRRSRPFAEPSGSQTCRSSRHSRSRAEYAPRVKMAAALPVEGRVLARLGWAGQTTDFFEHSLPLTMRGSSEALLGYWSAIFNRHFFHLSYRPLELTALGAAEPEPRIDLSARAV
jgi:hypothetical protein